MYNSDMLCISRGDNRGAADVIMLADIESVLSIDCVPRSWGTSERPELLKNLMSGDSNGQLFTGESDFQITQDSTEARCPDHALHRPFAHHFSKSKRQQKGTAQERPTSSSARPTTAAKTS